MATVALAVPAQAVTPPVWPTSGHIPSGSNCSMTTSLATPPNYDMRWADTSTPTVSNVFLNGGTTLVLPPAGGTMTYSARVLAPCSGANLVQALPIKNEGAYTVKTLEPVTSDVFGGLWSFSFPATISDVGVYRVGEFAVSRRYDTFITRSDFTYVSSVAASENDFIVGPWSLKKLYVLRATTLSNSLSATKVKKGKTVKATASLKMATASGYVAAAGAKVAVQTKVGKRRWVTNATLTANASGVVTYSFVLAATTSVRFVHATTHSGSFTNGATSAIRVVKRKV
jgi:hypothetical protein